MWTKNISNTNVDLYTKCNNMDKKRKITNAVSKSAIIGGGAVAAKFAAKDNSCLQKGATAIVDFLAKNSNKCLQFIDKKQNFTKNITEVLDKVTKSSAKTKALGFVGVVVALQFINSIRFNNQAKGMIKGYKELAEPLSNMGRILDEYSWHAENCNN